MLHFFDDCTAVPFTPQRRLRAHQREKDGLFEGTEVFRHCIYIVDSRGQRTSSASTDVFLLTSKNYILNN
jgi:hypothetical protein